MQTEKETLRSGGLAIEDLGQIARITFPEGWMESELPSYSSGFGTRSFRQVKRQGAPGAIFCFYYRGLPVERACAGRFSTILAESPHTLTDDELASIAEVLRDRQPSDQFKMRSAKTRDLNGRAVLLVDGTFTEFGDDLRAVFVDAGGGGSIVQELFFQAPHALFKKYGAEAGQVFKSIGWK